MGLGFGETNGDCVRACEYVCMGVCVCVCIRGVLIYSTVGQREVFGVDVKV